MHLHVYNIFIWIASVYCDYGYNFLFPILVVGSARLLLVLSVSS